MSDYDREKFGPQPPLSIDDAVAMFSKLLGRSIERKPAPAARFTVDSNWRSEPPEVGEAARFEDAERILQILCAEPGICPDPRCRRLRGCRGLQALRTGRYPRTPQPSRRTAGADAVRFAMALYANKTLAIGGHVRL
jgi:hypothetical protein